MKIESIIWKALEEAGCDIIVDLDTSIITVNTPDNQQWDFTRPMCLVSRDKEKRLVTTRYERGED